MTPLADSAVFVDTNILIYATFAGTPFHDLACARLSGLESDGAVFWTSRQVLREFLAVTTRPGFILPMPALAAVSEAVRRFEVALRIADEDAVTTALLLDLLKTRTIKGRQIHDANIVATMRKYRILSLLTHNTDDFERYEPDITLLPLMG